MTESAIDQEQNCLEHFVYITYKYVCAYMNSIMEQLSIVRD